MNELIKYLNDTFGIETTIIPLEKQLLQQLPLFITATFNVQETTIYGHQICLLIVKNEANIPTPDSLFKQMLFVSQKTGIPVVYVFGNIVSYNIKRMIQKGINFIIPHKQLFIPALMMDLRKVPVTIPQKTELLMPIAQLVLLYHLQKEILNSVTTQHLADKLNQNYRTMSRAIKSLEELDLCNLVGGKEKKIQFTAKGKKLWLKARKNFQNPVERIVFTDELLKGENVYTSNINALAHYSMLNDETRRYYAFNRNELKNLAIETNKYAGDNVIEIWRYNPEQLSNDEYVDKLSLYLLLKNDSDERIQNELEQIINGMQWLEE